MNLELRTLLVISAIAVLVPFLVRLLRHRVAEVVLLLGLGVIFGPGVLGWIDVTEPISLLSELGMGLLFFLAGYEIERSSVTGYGGRLAAIGWFVSLGLASLVSWLFVWTGYVQDGVGFAIALTTTALGTLLPILRDARQLDTPFGKLFMGAGAWGELGSIIAIAVLLGSKSTVAGIAALIVLGIVAGILLVLPPQLRTPLVDSVIRQGNDSSAQTGVRLVMLLLILLLFVSSGLGIDAVLGAFLAGMIAKRFNQDEDTPRVQHKIEGIAFGFFVPVFFVVSGANLDIASIVADPLRMIVMLVVMLVVRGLPQVVIYRKALPDVHERLALGLFVATALPLLVAITTLEVGIGAMTEQTAAALVGAGALSVLIFPAAAEVMGMRSRQRRIERQHSAHLVTEG